MSKKYNELEKLMDIFANMPPWSGGYLDIRWKNKQRKMPTK